MEEGLQFEYDDMFVPRSSAESIEPTLESYYLHISAHAHPYTQEHVHKHTHSHTQTHTQIHTHTHHTHTVPPPSLAFQQDI